MSADLLTGSLWLLNGLIVLAVCAMQRSRSAILLALALIVSPAFYLTLLVVLRDVAAVRAFASANRTGTLLNILQLALLCWSAFLAFRLLRAKPGSRIDYLGRLSPPGPDEIEWALVILARAKVHDQFNQVTVKWGQEDLLLNRAMQIAAGRDGGARVKMIIRLLQPRLYRRATAKWALRKVHFEEPDTEEG